eukprot:2344435-Pyramimonas_sp.AAC.3
MQDAHAQPELAGARSALRHAGAPRHGSVLDSAQRPVRGLPDTPDHPRVVHLCRKGAVHAGPGCEVDVRVG